MKKEIKALFNDFPNLIYLAIDLRKEKELSYQEISNYFEGLGYKCSRTMMERFYSKYIGNIRRSRSGKNNSFYGKNHSDITKEKLSEIRIKNGTAKGKNNPMYGKSGELSPAWKGGISSRQMIFYSSVDWAEKRFEIMERDNFSCKKCGFSSSKSHNSLNVHHINSIANCWERRLDNFNLITLCVFCHKETFGKENDFIHLFEDIVRTT